MREHASEQLAPISSALKRLCFRPFQELTKWAGAIRVALGAGNPNQIRPAGTLKQRSRGIVDTDRELSGGPQNLP